MANSNPNPTTRFKPGKSGNPSGKLPGTKHRSTIVRRWMETDEKITNPITLKEEKLTQEDIITLIQIKEARKGNTHAYHAIMDSMYGKPTQRNELTADIRESLETEEDKGAPDLTKLTPQQREELKLYEDKVGKALADMYTKYFSYVDHE